VIDLGGARRLQPEHQRQPRLLADRRPLRQHPQQQPHHEHAHHAWACSRRSSTIWCRICSSASARRSRLPLSGGGGNSYGVDFVLGGWLLEAL
jgi:hypothetical protein